LNLLVISERFWPEGSGGTLAVYLTTKLLATCGDFKVTVVTGTRNPVKISGASFIIDEAFRIPSKPVRWLYFLRPFVKTRYKNLIRKFDIIYIPYGYPLIPLAKEVDRKVIVHLHDYQPIAYNSTILHGQRGGLVHDIKTELTYELLEHYSMKRAMMGSLLVPITMLCRAWVNQADVIICVSWRQAEIISSSAPELIRKIKVVYNLLPEIPPTEEKLKHPTFTYVGGDSYIKGFHVFLKASQKLLKRGARTSFILAGSYRDSSRKMVGRLGKNYNLLGYVNHERALKLYSKSFAVLFPSISEEPLPYTVMESMLVGTVPIASKIGGVPEIVKGTHAERMMFTPGDSDEMSDRMEEILSLSREQLIDIGFSLRETIFKKFNNNLIKRQLLDIFNNT